MVNPASKEDYKFRARFKANKMIWSKETEIQ